MRLAELEQQYSAAMTAATQPFTVPTMSDVGTLAMQTDAQLASLAGDSGGAQAYSDMRRAVEAERQALAKQKTQLEAELAAKQQELEQMFGASSEQLQQQQKLIADKERSIKQENQSVMESVSMQTDYIEQLEHKQVRAVLRTR